MVTNAKEQYTLAYRYFRSSVNHVEIFDTFDECLNFLTGSVELSEEIVIKAHNSVLNKSHKFTGTLKPAFNRKLLTVLSYTFALAESA